MRAFLAKAAAVLATYGPWGIFVLALLDSMGVPLPVIDIVLISVAIESAKSPSHAYYTALLAIVGSVAGNVFLFQSARHGRRLVSRNKPASDRQQKFQAWFHRYGLLTVFIPAVVPLIPLPLKVFVISAGAMHTPFGRFMAVILTARVIRYLGEAYLALKLGQDAEGFLRHNLWTLTGVAIGMAMVLVFLIRWMDRRQEMA